MVKMRKGQFDESVQRSLVQACRNIELVETKKYLEDDAIATEKAAQLSREQSEEKKGEGSGDVVAHTHEYSITSDGLNGYSTFELKMRFSANRPSNIPKAIISTGKNIPQTSRALQEIIKDRYVYQRALLDEVVYNILYTASDKPLNKRINFKQLDLFLKTELLNNGIDIPYHFTVTDRDGTEVYHCPDYTKEGSENTYPQVLFKNDPPARMACNCIEISFQEPRPQISDDCGKCTCLKAGNTYISENDRPGTDKRTCRTHCPVAEYVLTTTLRHGCCKLCVSQTYKEDHDSTDCKCNSCTKHTTGFNPVTGRNYPAPADHGAKCNYKYVPCTKYFVKF